ncbi:polysaccharide biosynthesis C-terminal domain-containing protein [Natronosalvus rutilus]|uniref:Polysaccharide biosynthesis C-terminal domain-containing protein n=1 Tax=Natronosalvus rutilus TaxID=2953753 RepID=A0A9E7SS34_9EURY|nr:polysaccharide biosynthesis C-terminal domain-containing protein [Natronosalvus rutilus]UTF52074.1 polysaccharide biosynthesis C-terminal domain-containing protein [Natronosalvus rutilus]
MRNSFSSAVVSIIVSKAYILLLGVGFTPVLVRLLGPVEYGRYALVLSVYSVVGIVLVSGTGDTVRKYISERSDAAWQAAIFGYVFRAVFFIGLLAATLFSLAAYTGLAASTFGPAFTSLFYVLAAYLVFNQLATHVLWTLMGLQLESRSEPLKVVKETLFVAFAITFVYHGYGVEGVLLGSIVSSAFTIVFGLAIVSRLLPVRQAFFSSGVDLPKRQILTYTASTIGFFLFLTSLYHVDVLLLQVWLSDEFVGYYKGALVIAEVLWFAPIAVQYALLQRVSHLWERGDIDAIEQQSQIVTRYVFLFTTLLVLGLAALAADFVPLYLGESFRPAITPLLLLLPGVLGFAVARPSLAINQARRSLRPLLVATGASSLINVLLNLLLIPGYGMIGAAIATSIGYGSLVVFQTAIARRMGYRPLAGIRWGATFVTIIVSATSIFLVSWTIDSSILSLVIVPPFGAIVFAVASIMTGAITSDDLEEIASATALPKTVERQLLELIERIPTRHE